MKLRSRLALTLGIASVVLLVLLGWAQSRWSTRLRVDALAEAAVHRMESGGRARCEANPERWPGSRREQRMHRPPGPMPWTRHRVSAYGADFVSLNPDSPPFPKALAKELSADNPVVSSRSDEGRRTHVAVRMPWDEGPCAVVLVRAKGPPSWFSGPVLIPAILVALVTILVALGTAGPVVRRVRRLTESVRRLGTATEEPIEVEGHDEIAELAHAFEEGRQTIREQLASLRAREAALRDYIANTTHDVMLPLSVLQGHLVSLQQRIEAGETLSPNAVVPSIEESQYLGSLLHNLNAAARLDATEGLANRNTLDLGRLVHRVVDRHRPVATRKQVALDVATPEEIIEIEGDLTLLEQAIGNVVQNAVRYNDAGGHVAVVLRGSTGAWHLDVMDDGPGIPEADRERVLQPSFRGTEARTRHPHGMGLGLHIANDVCKRHALRLTLGETEGGGLTVRVGPSGQERGEP